MQLAIDNKPCRVAPLICSHWQPLASTGKVCSTLSAFEPSSPAAETDHPTKSAPARNGNSRSRGGQQRGAGVYRRGTADCVCAISRVQCLEKSEKRKKSKKSKKNWKTGKLEMTKKVANYVYHFSFSLSFSLSLPFFFSFSRFD